MFWSTISGLAQFVTPLYANIHNNWRISGTFCTEVESLGAGRCPLLFFKDKAIQLAFLNKQVNLPLPESHLTGIYQQACQLTFFNYSCGIYKICLVFWSVKGNSEIINSNINFISYKAPQLKQQRISRGSEEFEGRLIFHID